MEIKKELSSQETAALLVILQDRFEKNRNRHVGIEWQKVKDKLLASSDKIWSLYQMDNTNGEPDVIGEDKNTGEFIFCDCSAESPKGRRSLCYDSEGLASRKDFKPDNNVIDLAAEMGIEILTEEEYKDLQKLEVFDLKTSSWLKTPSEMRKLGGALFGDFRFGRVFIYHNGAQSYYGARAFRGILKV